MGIILPAALDEAVDAAAERPDALLLAGGTDVMVEVNFGHLRPIEVIALRGVTELRAWTVHGWDGTRHVRLGAGVPYAAMEHGELAMLLPALAQAARTVGSPQIRAAGTLGGNLGTCSPAGDGLPVLAAMDATVHLTSTSGSRSLPVGDFMLGVKRNARQPGEVITAIDIPVVEGWQGYAKVGVRNAMVIAVASACLAVGSEGVRLALGSVAPTAIRCREAEEWLRTEHETAGHAPVSNALAEEFGRRAADEARPIDDHRSSAAYRRHAVAVLSGRLLRRAFPETDPDEEPS